MHTEGQSQKKLLDMRGSRAPEEAVQKAQPTSITELWGQVGQTDKGVIPGKTLKH